MVLLVVLFVSVGLIRLDLLPPNTDEAGYAILALKPSGGAVLLGESKLFTMQLYALLLPSSPDPVWRARFVSVLTTAVTLLFLGCFRTSPDRKYSALLPAVLYALCPLAFFYARIAMPEAYLVTAGCAVLLAANALAVRPSRGRAVLLGGCLVFAATIQMIALLFFAFPLVAIVFLGTAPWKRYLKPLVLCYVIPFLAVMVLWKLGWGADVLRNGFIAKFKGDAWTAPVGQALHLAFANTRLIYRWLSSSMTPLVFWLGMGGALLAVVRQQRSGLFWVAVAAIYVVPFQLGAGILLPQYMLFMAVPLTFLACEAMAAAAPLLSTALRELTFVSIPAQAAVLTMATLVAMPLLLRDYSLISRPETAQISDDLHIGFVSGWPSGYGGRPVAQYLTRISKASPRAIRVLIFGVGDGAKRTLTLEILRAAKIHLDEPDLADAAIRKQVESLAVTEPTYVVMDDPPFMPYRKLDYAPIMASLVPLFLAEKPEGASATVVYRWQPANPGTPGTDLISRLERARISPETAGPAHPSAELIEEQGTGAKRPVLTTLAPVEIAFPMDAAGKATTLSFSLRLPANSRIPVEARIDLACNADRKNVFRQVVSPSEGAQWRSWKVPLDPGPSGSCSLLVRALPAIGGGLGGGRQARLLWSGLTLENE